MSICTSQHYSLWSLYQQSLGRHTYSTYIATYSLYQQLLGGISSIIPSCIVHQRIAVIVPPWRYYAYTSYIIYHSGNIKLWKGLISNSSCVRLSPLAQYQMTCYDSQFSNNRHMQALSQSTLTLPQPLHYPTIYHKVELDFLRRTFLQRIYLYVMGLVVHKDGNGNTHVFS